MFHLYGVFFICYISSNVRNPCDDKKREGGFSGSNSQEGPPPKGIPSLLSIEIPIDISILIHIERIIEIRLRIHTVKSTKRMMSTLYREKHIHTIAYTLNRGTKMLQNTL